MQYGDPRAKTGERARGDIKLLARSRLSIGARVRKERRTGMAMRIALAALAVAALLVISQSGPGAQAQGLQPFSSSPPNNPAGYPPQPVTRGGVPVPYSGTTVQ